MDLNKLSAKVKTAKTMAIDNIIKDQLPKVVNAPAPLLAVASQNKVLNAFKKFSARSCTSVKPLFNALIISVPICCPPYIYILQLNIYIDLQQKNGFLFSRFIS